MKIYEVSLRRIFMKLIDKKNNKKKKYIKIQWCIGEIIIIGTKEGLLRVILNGTTFEFTGNTTIEEDNNDPILIKAKDALFYYVDGKPEYLSEVPLVIEGSSFNKKVWSELRKIPYGKTKTYSEIAELIGSSKAQRAVGKSCGQNKLPVFIPCHRVVGKNSLTGFSAGLIWKKWLLDHEQNISEM